MANRVRGRDLEVRLDRMAASGPGSWVVGPAEKRGCGVASFYLDCFAPPDYSPSEIAQEQLVVLIHRYTRRVTKCFSVVVFVFCTPR